MVAAQPVGVKGEDPCKVDPWASEKCWGGWVLEFTGGFELGARRHRAFCELAKPTLKLFWLQTCTISAPGHLLGPSEPPSPSAQEACYLRGSEHCTAGFGRVCFCG